VTTPSDPPSPGGSGPETLRIKQLELRRREQAKLLVHDLRNPVAAIIGHLDLLRLELGEPLPSGAAAILDDLGVLSQKLLAMVAILLDVEELEEGVLQAEPVTLRLADYVEQRVRPYVGPARARLIDLALQVPPELEVSLDPDLVGRVIDNLLDNAVRYASRRGKVVVSAALDAGVLELRIGNDGPPVPEGDRALIFERYFRIEARRAAARENRGLGLYFCKLAVQAHRGTLEVASTPELPCVFVVRLPQG
jgi:two-component system heavy metal sensor histidine kinase CusS